MSRGGRGTKIHAAVDALGNPRRVHLTPGQAGDAPQAAALLAGDRPAAVIADRGYDSDAIRADIAARDAEAVIPPTANRREAIPYDRHTYKERHLVECFFLWLKRFRRVGTRYDKTARNYLAFVHVASIMALLR